MTKSRKSKLDFVLSGMILILFVIFQLNFVFSIGVCCADDAHNAGIAKNLANGIGYTSTIQEESNHFIIHKFDARVGNGPTTILPVALLISIFGNGYWVPGFTHVLVTTMLLVIIAVLLKKYDTEIKLSLFAVLFLFTAYALMTKHFEQWYAMLGEVPAALMFIIGILLFFWKDSRKVYFLSGFIFSLAVNAKLVVFLPFCVFIIAVYSLDKIFWKSERFKDLNHTFRVFIPLGIGFGLPFLGMEIWKLISLGGYGYTDYWTRYFDYVTDLGVTGNLLQDIWGRLGIRRAVFRDRFGIPFVFLPQFLLITWFFLRDNKKLIRIYSVLLIIISIYSVWWFIFSIGWARHYIIALIMVIFLAVLPISDFSRNKYIRVYLILLLFWTCITWGHLDNSLENLYGSFYTKTHQTKAMLEVPEILNDHPGEIILTQWWGSAADLNYLMGSTLNFTPYFDKNLEKGAVYWLAVNKEFIYFKDQNFLDFMASCEVIFESERHFVGECAIPANGFDK